MIFGDYLYEWEGGQTFFSAVQWGSNILFTCPRGVKHFLKLIWISQLINVLFIAMPLTTVAGARATIELSGPSVYFEGFLASIGITFLSVLPSYS